MAGRHRREVESRLEVLLAHLLKWECQPDKRSRSWANTIQAQRAELATACAGGVLRRHASERLAAMFRQARAVAANETGLPLDTFPADCPYTLDELLAG